MCVGNFRAEIKKTVRVTGLVFLQYRAEKTLTKPIRKCSKNRPVVSGLIEGFVSQI